MQKLWEPYFLGIFVFVYIWGKRRPKITFLGILSLEFLRTNLKQKFSGKSILRYGQSKAYIKRIQAKFGLLKSD